MPGNHRAKTGGVITPRTTRDLRLWYRLIYNVLAVWISTLRRRFICNERIKQTVALPIGFSLKSKVSFSKMQLFGIKFTIKQAVG
jgi:hypothetical protein